MADIEPNDNGVVEEVVGSSTTSVPVVPATIPMAPPVPLLDVSDQEKKKKDEEKQQVTSSAAVMNALNLEWCFGFNKQIGLRNLCVNDSRRLFFASSHIGVVHDFEKNQQKLLQGHRNNISCCAVSDEKRWLVTADAGPDSTIIIWDLTTCVPVQTYFNTHLEGTISVAITPDSKYVASLSAEYPQVLCIWEWTTDSEIPVCTAQIDPTFGPQSTIRFNLDNTCQLVTNSPTHALFYEWSYENGFVYFAPELNDQTFAKPVGRLTQSIFQTNRPNRALTATSLGNLVVWERVESEKGTKSSGCDKKALKLFKLQEKSINVLTVMGDLIVIGDSDGQVRFIDQNLHILMWYKHFNLGPIASISFSYSTKDFKSTYDLKPVEHDATLDYLKFICKDFLISSVTANIGYVTKSGTVVKVVNRLSDTPIQAVSCHPLLPRLCFGNHAGTIQLWDYEKKSLISTRQFVKSSPITCIKFEPRGHYIAVGFKNGHLQLLDAISLEDCLKTPFTYSKDAITHIQFSHDATYLATTESDTISVYKCNFINEKLNDKIATEIYTFYGRYRSHYKEIVTLLFGTHPDTGETRLLTLGKDRYLVEYDLENSNFDDLVIKEKYRIEQYGKPMAMIWHPSIYKESFILSVNDQWKYKMYNTTTKMCRKTLLGPTYGSFVKKMTMLPAQNKGSSYMAYITEDKLGIQKFPLTGNPFDSIAIFAHPDGVANFDSSYDGKYLFTTGGDNNNVFMWGINLNSLEAQSTLGGPDLKPFYGLIQGGREGEFFKEMRELFYYSQLRDHGLHENTERVAKLTIPLGEIPFVMRGLGFYPTEQEIENMINEVKFSKYVDTNELVEQINLDDFIRLYINHRPAFGLDPYEIYNAFRVLNKKYEPVAEAPQTLARHVFLDELQSRGEHMTDFELADCVANLLHTNHQVDELSKEEIDELISKYLPDQVTVDKFMNEIVGIDTNDFEDILQTWEQIKQKNTARLHQSKRILSARLEDL